MSIFPQKVHLSTFLCRFDSKNGLFLENTKNQTSFSAGPNQKSEKKKKNLKKIKKHFFYIVKCLFENLIRKSASHVQRTSLLVLRGCIITYKHSYNKNLVSIPYPFQFKNIFNYGIGYTCGYNWAKFGVQNKSGACNISSLSRLTSKELWMVNIVSNSIGTLPRHLFLLEVR